MPSLDELIAYMRKRVAEDATGVISISTEGVKDILSRLESLRDSEKELPEPIAMVVCSKCGHLDSQTKALIDQLRSICITDRARVKEAEAFADKQFQYAGRVLEQANKAESSLRELEIGRNRYEFVRTLNVPQFAAIFKTALNGEGRFDDLVDKAMTRHLTGEK